jgi:hypothetical protein
MVFTSGFTTSIRRGQWGTFLAGFIIPASSKVNLYLDESVPCSFAKKLCRFKKLLSIRSGFATLDCKGLFLSCLIRPHEEKGSTLKLLASNYSLVKPSERSILPEYRKPFGIIAEGLSRLNWLPGRDSNPRPIG